MIHVEECEECFHCCCFGSFLFFFFLLLHRNFSVEFCSGSHASSYEFRFLVIPWTLHSSYLLSDSLFLSFSSGLLLSVRRKILCIDTNFRKTKKKKKMKKKNVQREAESKNSRRKTGKLKIKEIVKRM